MEKIDIIKPIARIVLKVLKDDVEGIYTGRVLINRCYAEGLTGSISGATMRKAIHLLRTNGYPICATSDGYFYTKKQFVLEDFIASLEARGESILRASKGMQINAK